MKSILLSIKPKYVAKILNGEKTIEVRKRFPEEYKGWVYIYCTKREEVLLHCFLDNKDIGYKVFQDNIKHQYWLNTACYDDTNKLNGKVVARFYCDKVEPIWCSGFYEDLSFGKGKCIDSYKTDTYDEQTLLDKSCLTEEEMHDYFDCECQRWAIHISQLEIFDKPKELSEFYKVGYLRECYNLESHFADIEGCDGGINESYVEECYEKLDKEYQLAKAPQSYMFIEVEE